MEYWYEKHDDKWTFCYTLDKDDQEKVDSIMPEVIKIFEGEGGMEESEVD